jgi:hypothetical protein
MASEALPRRSSVMEHYSHHIGWLNAHPVSHAGRSFAFDPFAFLARWDQLVTAAYFDNLGLLFKVSIQGSGRAASRMRASSLIPE